MAAMTAAAETMQDTTAAPVLELAADLSPAVTALERAWRMIQAQFPGTPAATLVVKRDQFAWGHTTVAKTWAASTVDATDEASHFEVMISGENLRRGARFVAATLLHESAHAANLAAGKLDTDSNGRHSRVFADEAEARGLVVTQAGWRGWTGTELPEDVATTGWHRKLVATIERGLAKAAAPAAPSISHLPKPQPQPEGEGEGEGGTLVILPPAAPVAPRKRGNRNLLVATCGCGMKIRVSQGVLDTCQPTCQVCTEQFRAA
jgi:hypothetical protein